MPRRRVAKILNCLHLSHYINVEYGHDGFQAVVVEGVQRVGKSSYASQAVAEAYGQWDYSQSVPTVKTPDFDEAKKWVVFKPKEFLDLVLNIERKQKALIWDDAGFWLFALDWYEPFVKAVSRYVQLAGRQFSTLIFTTPSAELISSKVLGSLPNVYLGIVKETRSVVDTPLEKPRVAKVYRRWDFPDGKRGGVVTCFEDYFNAILPESYFSWYKPKSDEYMKVGLELLQNEVDRLQKRMSGKEEEAFQESVHKVVGDPDRLKQIDEVMRQYSVP